MQIKHLKLYHYRRRSQPTMGMSGKQAITPQPSKGINKLCCDCIDFDGFKVTPDECLDVVARKNAQRKARESKSATTNKQ